MLMPKILNVKQYPKIRLRDTYDMKLIKEKIDLNNMPILKALNRYKKISPVRFHMPGHKAGKPGRKYLGNICNIDITELSFSDNLLKSEGIIMRAENLCALSYNAESVKFCTCGTTVLILSLLHSVKNKGKSIIIERNSHKSVYSALKICNIEPVITDNNYDKETNLFTHITAGDIAKALEKNPDVLGALITSPDYFGFEADIKGISKVLKSKNKLLFVDAAHGSHLPFINKDIYNNADVYVCSAHKTLLALTQGSFAVFNNFLLYDEFLKSFDIFHTTSPSYPILASLDFSREYMQKLGLQKLLDLKKITDKYKIMLNDLGYKCVENNDFTRLVIKTPNCSGFSLARYLESRRIFTELANDDYIIALLSVADEEKSLKKLYKALISLKIENITDSRKSIEYIPSVKSMPYLEASKAKKERVPLCNAAGRIAAAEAGLFPPSYPILCCGDRISPEICEFLLSNIGRTFGLENESILVVK